ncbi:MAG: 1-deoxy-D-xylulose-5-phosphate reductoisomerase [Methylophilaceae bacterium]|nr:1-deoxy-D-xylulose-5-phosphate reductoisomerase [Methylophilaceae bacterium]
MRHNTLQNVTILGSTGTIGKQTLDVISRHPNKFKVFALAANASVDLIFEQCLEFYPNYAALLNESAADQLAEKLKAAGSSTQVLAGLEAIEMLSSHPQVQVVMAAIVGAAGLKPAVAAAKAGKRILLANKETLVMSGNLFMQAVAKGGATLLPIDSEHNAIFQVMPQRESHNLNDSGIQRILLTASGGPFRKFSCQQLQHVTLQQALNHPNWVMGAKITIDSATLMNKGLEVIEAHWLFNAPADKIVVVVHPQSVIHSMVEYIDGSVLAQLGNPDMRTPIAYGLAYPERLESGVSSLDFMTLAKLEFEAPDTARFPCLRLAYDALKLGGTAPAVLNAANEIAVDAFIHHQIQFMDIPNMIESILSEAKIEEVTSLEQVISVDASSRLAAVEWVKRRSSNRMEATVC